MWVLTGPGEGRWRMAWGSQLTQWMCWEVHTSASSSRAMGVSSLFVWFQLTLWACLSVHLPAATQSCFQSLKARKMMSNTRNTYIYICSRISRNILLCCYLIKNSHARRAEAGTSSCFIQAQTNEFKNPLIIWRSWWCWRELKPQFSHRNRLIVKQDLQTLVSSC